MTKVYTQYGVEGLCITSQGNRHKLLDEFITIVEHCPAKDGFIYDASYLLDEILLSHLEENYDFEIIKEKAQERPTCRSRVYGYTSRYSCELDELTIKFLEKCQEERNLSTKQKQFIASYKEEAANLGLKIVEE